MLENYKDVIRVEDLTDRLEELQRELLEAFEGNEALTELAASYQEIGEEFDEFDFAGRLAPEVDEWNRIVTTLDELKGQGGDHHWLGDWYPDTLIGEANFQDYAQQLAEDVCDTPTSWPFCHIDWKEAAESLAQDYSEIDIAGHTYFYR